MLSLPTRLKLENILQRIGNGEQVSLTESIYIHKFADKNQTVSGWLKQAKYKQQNNQDDSIENFLNDLSICSPDSDSIYKRDEDDLGEWFSGAPSWLGRS